MVLVPYPRFLFSPAPSPPPPHPCPFPQVCQHYSSTFWEDHKSLSFKLRVQQFLEAMRGGSGSAAAALDYGRTHLVPALSCAADEELLADVLSLLAYQDPLDSPCGHLMRPARR